MTSTNYKFVAQEDSDDCSVVNNSDDIRSENTNKRKLEIREVTPGVAATTTTTTTAHTIGSGGDANKKRKENSPHPIRQELLGRFENVKSKDARSPPPVTATEAAAEQNAHSSSTDPDPASGINFLNALGPAQLALRTKTHIQLKITAFESSQMGSSKSKECRVVVSGGMDLKNMGQLIAYLTGNTGEYNWHSQKGKAYKHSHFCMNFHSDTSSKQVGVFIAEKAMWKSLPIKNPVLDKAVKIAQIFQGLTVTPRLGIGYDSTQAKSVEFVWTSCGTKKKGDNQKYRIECEGIVPNRCVFGAKTTLPRVVNAIRGENKNTKITLNGKSLYKTNDVLRGNRNIPSRLQFGSNIGRSIKSVANEDAANPIVNCDDGSTIVPGQGKIQDILSEGMFSMTNVKTTWLPPTL